MNSEFNGRPENPSVCEAQFWKSLEELLPRLRAGTGIQLALEPHPDDFIEDGLAAVNMIRGINSPNVSFLYCAPHTFHQGGNMAEIMRAAGDRLTMLHVADGFDHRASSGLRYITNPPGNAVRVHQHLDIGQGEVPWDTFFGTLEELRVRRDHDRLRVRLGGAGPRVQPPQPGGDPAADRGLGPSALGDREPGASDSPLMAMPM